MQRDHFSFLLDDSDNEFFSKLAQEEASRAQRLKLDAFIDQIDLDIENIKVAGASEFGGAMIRAGEYLEKVASAGMPGHVFDMVFEKVASAAIDNDIDIVAQELNGMFGGSVDPRVISSLEKQAGQICRNLGIEKDAVFRAGAALLGKSFGKARGLLGKARAGAAAVPAYARQGVSNVRARGLASEGRRLNEQMRSLRASPSVAAGSAQEAGVQGAIRHTSKRQEALRAKVRDFKAKNPNAQFKRPASTPKAKVKAALPPKATSLAKTVPGTRTMPGMNTIKIGPATPTISNMAPPSASLSTRTLGAKAGKAPTPAPAAPGASKVESGRRKAIDSGKSDAVEAKAKKAKKDQDKLEDRNKKDGERAEDRSNEGQSGKQEKSRVEAAGAADSPGVMDTFKKATDSGWSSLSSQEKGALIRAGLYTAAGYRLVTGRGVVTGGQGIV